MRVLFAWHAAVEPEYRKLFHELAKLGIDLRALLPAAWTEGGRLQRPNQEGWHDYHTLIQPVLFRNRIKRFFYPNFLALVRAIKQFQPDIVHIFEEPYSLVCVQLVGLTRKFHSRAKIIIQSFENLPPAHSPLFNIIENFILQRANALISVPHEGEALWRARGFRGALYQVPVGVEDTLFKKVDAASMGLLPTKLDSSICLAYVGRLVPQKGVSLVLQALYYLLKENMNVELFIVGSGPDKDTLKLQANQLRLSDRVTFIDSLQSHYLPLLYSNIDILVLPSLTTNKWKEQFGRVLIEAMACEVAVVGSSSGEIPHIIGDAGIIFPEGELTALVEVLKELVLNPDLREKLGKAGRERVLEKFTWKCVSNQLCEIYKEVKN